MGSPRARLVSLDSSASFPAVVLAVTVLGLQSGCASSHPHLSFSVEQRIVRETTLDDLPDGKAQPGDTVVRVMRTGKHTSGACSGALVGPRHILTAQHCVVQLDAKREMTFRTLSPGDMHVELGGGYLPWGRAGVREVISCAGYTHDLEHDVAMLVLAKPVPDSVKPYEISYALPRGEAAVLQHSGFGTNAPVKMVPFTGWGITQVERHSFQGPLLVANDDFIAVNMDGAPGDSGGPILDVASGKIISVVSRGRSAEEQKEMPMVTGPRLKTCRAAIELALRR